MSFQSETTVNMTWIFNKLSSAFIGCGDNCRDDYPTYCDNYAIIFMSIMHNYDATITITTVMLQLAANAQL